jgi:cardiolipin synthase
MTIANMITVLRVILVPIFLIYMINGRTLASLVIFGIATVSDAVDGFIARVFDQKSNLGAHLDPLADKILLTTAYIILAVFKMIPSWLTVLIISRDVIILLGVLVFYLTHYPVAIHPSILSKATTCIQLATVIIVLSSDYMKIPLSNPSIFWLAGLLTIASGLQYIRIGLIILSKGMNSNFS